MFRPLAIVAVLQLLQPALGAQSESFIGDSVLGVELNEVVAEVSAATSDLAEELTSGSLERRRREDLERQEITSVGVYVRTCDCVRERSVVRHRPHDSVKLRHTSIRTPLNKWVQPLKKAISYSAVL